MSLSTPTTYNKNDTIHNALFVSLYVVIDLPIYWIVGSNQKTQVYSKVSCDK